MTTSSPQAGRIKEPGLYKFTIDMMNYKYTIEAVNYATYIWQAGNGNGWGSPANPLVLTDDNTGTYQGFMYLEGEFKFRSQETNWDALLALPQNKAGMPALQWNGIPLRNAG